MRVSAGWMCLLPQSVMMMNRLLRPMGRRRCIQVRCRRIYCRRARAGREQEAPERRMKWQMGCRAFPMVRCRQAALPGCRANLCHRGKCRRVRKLLRGSLCRSPANRDRKWAGKWAGQHRVFQMALAMLICLMACQLIAARRPLTMAGIAAGARGRMSLGMSMVYLTGFA